MKDNREILDKAHDIEQKECRLIRRKEFGSMLPAEMDYVQKRKLIQSWQINYFRRLKNIGIFNLKG